MKNKVVKFIVRLSLIHIFVRQFMDLIKENMDLRLKVEKGLKAANMEFAIARAGMSEQVLNTCLLYTSSELSVEMQ